MSRKAGKKSNKYFIRGESLAKTSNLEDKTWRKMERRYNVDEELEGINLEAVNLENEEAIVLPNSTEEAEETTEIKEVVEENNDSVVDEEKEALKRDINKERRARKDAVKRNKELEARIAALEEATKVNKKTTLEELVENGVDESIAKSIAAAIDKKQSNSNKIEQELADMKFKLELSEKSKESNFSDIMDYEDEVKGLVDKGLTIEQAYYALNYDKNKIVNTKSEIERKVEAKIQNNQARKEILGNINSNAGGVVSNNESKPKASAAEIAAARMAGIDINDYLAAKNANSIKQYDDYNKRKTK